MAEDKSIRVTEAAHLAAISHVKPKGILSQWVSDAIFEKIERDRTKECVTLERQKQPASA